MTKPIQNHRSLRHVAAAMLAGFSLLLTGCFITPGKFTSELVLGPDQDFTFTYEGEIFFLGLSRLAEMGESAKEFEPEECYVDGTSEVRECTRNEIEGQRSAWKSGESQRTAEAKQQAEQMSAMMGGIDPADPEAVVKFTRMLLRQKGWERVVDKGDGVFDISYRLNGKLTHDFMFPVIEGVPSTNPFVQVLLRDGDVVRVNAPGFSAQNDENPMAAMMGGMGAMAGLAALGEEGEGGEKPAMPDIPQIEGTFSIVLKGSKRILANNTDEGASRTPTGEVLVWEISPRSKAAPTALVDLAP